MAKTHKTYSELSSELDTIMLKLQADDLDVDAAIDYYEQGIELTKQIADYLTKSENKLTELQKLAGN